jgi:asparagine synthase (glutamine-hydrolysing)
MCGITGAVWTRAELAIEPSTVARMAQQIAHRGPDDVGTFQAPLGVGPRGLQPGVALGFRRLSIIDLAGGHQPMSNEDGSVWVVFNGEIYNYLELRRRLEGNGHRFATRSDTESIVHLYEDLERECFQHFNGMFAIGIWDQHRGQLVLARDRLGQKPLYYARHEGRLLFGSELKCFAEVPGVLSEIDPDAIDAYLTYQYIPHPRTIWRGVYKLPPGHLLVYRDDQIRIQRYWQIDFQTERRIGSEQAIAELQPLLTDAVGKRLVADVPVGAFLSGGVDSSLIVALAQAQRSDPIRTFSIGFSVADYDETHYAAQVAEYLGTKHQRFEVRPDAVSVLDRLVWHFDEPFGDSSAIPTWYLSELTRGEVKVALSGDGGDELFAGYDRYRALWLSRWLDRLGPLQRLAAAQWIQRLPESATRKSLLRRGKRFCEAIGLPPERRYMFWLQIFNERRRGELYRTEFVERLSGEDPFEFIHQAWQAVGSRDLVTRASLTDLQTYLPCDLCTKVDITSMAHGLEVRQPFLDYRVAEFAAGLPIDLKFRRGVGKRLLRAAFGPQLPKAIWDRAKMGFGVPLAKWFRQELRELVADTLLASDARSYQYFRPEAVRRLVEEHQSGRLDHSYRLWNLLVLELWLRRWSPSPAV